MEHGVAREHVVQQLAAVLVVPDLGIDPSFGALRGDPQMAALLRRIGLPVVR